MLLQHIGRAFKRNVVPGLILQCFALSIALCYFLWPESHGVFLFFSELKATHGWRYAFIATALFGGFLPCVYLIASGQIQDKWLQALLFYTLFWAIKGVEVDLFYQVQSYWFGHEATLRTIITKTAVDQFLYSALWAAPSIVLVYLWRDCGFNVRRWWREARKPDLWRITVPTVIFSNWIVWIPAVSIIYSMPSELQLPLFNIVLCFFVLLLATLSRKEERGNDTDLDEVPAVEPVRE